MTISDLTQFEKDIILDCLKAILSEKFLLEAEIQIRVGIDKQDLEDVVKRWPEFRSDSIVDAYAVRGCMNDALNDISTAKWSQWIRGSQNQVRDLIEKCPKMFEWEKF